MSTSKQNVGFHVTAETSPLRQRTCASRSRLSFVRPAGLGAVKRKYTRRGKHKHLSSVDILLQRFLAVLHIPVRIIEVWGLFLSSTASNTAF